MAGIEILTSKTVTKIDSSEDEIVFATACGKQYRMYHEHDCCESVYVEDICGDLDDLLDTPILVARESCGGPDEANAIRQELLDPEEFIVEKLRGFAELPYYGGESETWTFYVLRTIKGSVTIRWYGTSNGYYSESVSFCEIKN